MTPPLPPARVAAVFNLALTRPLSLVWRAIIPFPEERELGETRDTIHVASPS